MLHLLDLYKAPVLVMLVFLFYTVLWKIKEVELQRSHNIKSMVLHSSLRPTQKYFAIIARVLTICIIVFILLHFIFRDSLVLTQPLIEFKSNVHLFVGMLLSVFGLSLCRISQITMAKSWRVGIDDTAKPGLVTKGVYSLVRNPTYTGLFLMCAGIFIILPTMLISQWILAFFFLLEFQVRCEEEYLEKQYGEAYLKYAKKTKRYLPYLY